MWLPHSIGFCVDKHVNFAVSGSLIREQLPFELLTDACAVVVGVAVIAPECRRRDESVCKDAGMIGLLQRVVRLHNEL